MNYQIEQGFVLWLTGLSQAGKTTVSKKLEHVLASGGVKVERLDGDVVRQSLTKDLGFSPEDRDTNIERVTFVTKLLSRNNVAVLVAFISPYRSHRERARQETTNFIEVFVNAPLAVCEQRDTKGLYRKAREGLVEHFTGISDVYEKPVRPELELRTDSMTVDACVEKIINYLMAENYLRAVERVDAGLAT